MRKRIKRCIGKMMLEHIEECELCKRRIQALLNGETALRASKMTKWWEHDMEDT